MIADHEIGGGGIFVDEQEAGSGFEGLDDIGITLRSEKSIDSFEATRPGWLPDTQT